MLVVISLRLRKVACKRFGSRWVTTRAFTASSGVLVYGVSGLESAACTRPSICCLIGDHLTEKSATVKWIDVSNLQKRSRRLKDQTVGTAGPAWSKQQGYMWENPPYSSIHESLVGCIFGKLYHRANLPPSLRLIARLAVELEHFVCDPATPPIIEKLWFKGVAMHAYSVPYTTHELETN